MSDTSKESTGAPSRAMAGQSRLSAYLLALRPWSFSASLAPVALGAALAYRVVHHFSPLVFVASCVTALSVHAAGNVVNTYFDYMRGVDSRTSSDDRTLVDRRLTPGEVVHLGALLYTIGCVGFILLAGCSEARMEHLALVYFGGLSSSFLYTGGLGLKYIALGDLLVLVTFGPVCVLYSFVAQAGQMDPAPLWYAMPLAMNTEAILHANNARDRQQDARAGAVTLALLLGPTGSHVFYALLLFVPYLLFALLAARSRWLLLPLITLPSAFNLERQFRDGRLARLPQHTARLNIYFGLFYILAVVLADYLPGLH
ncbi:ubiA prenyltransferase domain-containing protein 1 homolog isoform X6 [Dermacentor silvarum]|nr:ubiA prenyltransferase domain-containing protein 1 homolog isoform X5 [Dermacentor silvarum]XP_049515890.1 ubiA prenyltransferase domain-containing protein 1 homolog isoform X5 [Dermacentor silvarum]XP_049515891.1 ubiA prenyltransferase domain-containing protein 1 homolog isoform X6 [Dermacentor silvarum]